MSGATNYVRPRGRFARGRAACAAMLVQASSDSPATTIYANSAASGVSGSTLVGDPGFGDMAGAAMPTERRGVRRTMQRTNALAAKNLALLLRAGSAFADGHDCSPGQIVMPISMRHSFSTRRGRTAAL